MLSRNKVIISSAGSRKTTYLIEQALEQGSSEILLTTYTLENLDQIRGYIVQKCGCIPPNITIQTWFSFLLRHGVYPYQNYLTRQIVRSIDFVAEPPRGTKRANIEKYYLDSGRNIYSKVLSDFVVRCNDRSQGLVIDRLEKIYDYIYIDEVQDLNGYDLEFLSLLFNSNINTFSVGDPRQWTYATNTSSKNKRYRGAKIVEWFREKESLGDCIVEENNSCYRSNQTICDFADNLYPDLKKSVSSVQDITGHDGVYVVSKKDVHNYFAKYHPRILRYDKNVDTMGLPALNYGASKGKTFDRVLIFPTKPIAKYLDTGINNLGDVSKSKLYVAVTRARYSVAFVHESKSETIIPYYDSD